MQSGHCLLDRSGISHSSAYQKKKKKKSLKMEIGCLIEKEISGLSLFVSWLYFWSPSVQGTFT